MSTILREPPPGASPEAKRPCRSPCCSPRAGGGRVGVFHITDLPHDLLGHILNMLDGQTILSFSSTSKGLRHTRSSVSALR